MLCTFLAEKTRFIFLLFWKDSLFLENYYHMRQIRFVNIKYVLILQRTGRFWGRRNINSCRRTLADTISHSHADRIILIRFEVLKHVVILGDWNILSIKYNIYCIGRTKALSYRIPC